MTAFELEKGMTPEKDQEIQDRWDDVARKASLTKTDNDRMIGDLADPKVIRANQIELHDFTVPATAAEIGDTAVSATVEATIDPTKASRAGDVIEVRDKVDLVFRDLQR